VPLPINSYMLEVIALWGVMNCHLTSVEKTEAGERQCNYICQDKSRERATTTWEFQCPRVLHVRDPKYKKYD